MKGRDEQVTKALEFFMAADPLLAEVMASQLDEGRSLTTGGKLAPEEVYRSLCSSIIGQQISVKAAAAIRGRFVDLVKDDYTPAGVLKIAQEDLKQVGLSNQKAGYLLSIAGSLVDGDVDISTLDAKSNKEVAEELVKLKGVGEWTAEMMMMSALGREDVFSVGDLGLRSAVSKLYGLDREDKDAIGKLAEKWSPHRTIASRVLWNYLDNEPVISD